MNPLNILLLGVMLVEAIVLIILLQLVNKKYPEKTVRKGQTKKKISVKQRIKQVKPEQWVIFAMYLMIFATAGYFFIANVFPDNPFNTNGNYILSAGDLSMTSELKGLYLDKDYVLGGKTFVGDLDARLVISEEPFNVIFNPKKVIAENATASLELSFIKPSTEVYFNEKLVIPNLKDYTKIQDFENESTEVWVKKDLTKSSYDTANNAENFIYANFPQHSIYSFAELEGGAPIIQDYEKTTTKINTQFRGDLKLAIYAEGSLDIEFTKLDLNSYVGADEYTVTITDLQGKEYFKEIYEDDGEKKDSKVSDDEQDFDIELNNLPRNIYHVTFKKDENNKYEDSTIQEIKINSNKVLILGTSLPLNSFNFYTNVDTEKTIGFKYWWASKTQEIHQNGIIRDTIDLDEDWLGEKYEQELTEKGDYNFRIKTGVVWVYSDVISPRKENWFYFPQETDSKLIDSDIIIIDKNKLQINGDEVVYTEGVEITEDSKFKIQVLDKTQIYFKEIKLILKENEETGLRLV
tara:strand:+ start:563 stop:2125 length:1563 start_codon:yes stop_codon:yes gene_type:complete